MDSPGPGFNFFLFRDIPELVGLKPLKIEGNFRDYVRFRPSGPSENANIYVTIGLVTWEFHGELPKTIDNSPPPVFDASYDKFPVYSDIITFPTTYLIE